MVAFIGAVICIIAAVHTGSSRAASQQQPPADNASLYPDSVAQTPASRGAVARVGPLGALHGSETPETTTLRGLTGVIGLTGHDPTVSRLICTPIPAVECDPRNLAQQADEPGEERDQLRSAAEELRRTVLQQKDQILTDQKTIRELTGKLTECERGRGGERRATGSASGILGTRGGDAGTRHRDRIMVRDSPASDPGGAAHLLTVRAVDELEQAITQLKDRIEKLESDIEPFPHNHTDADTSRAPGGPGGRPEGRSGADAGGPRRMDDLEGELERKVELLEKERKALRLETQQHRQEIDQGVNRLHQRLMGLEEGASLGYLFPEGFRLSFPSRTNYMYGVVKHAVPELRAFTACLWLRPAVGGVGTPLSYAVPEQPNELVLLQGLHTPAELLVNDKVAQLPLNLSRGSWQHICVSWSQKGGLWQAYQGGKLRGEGHGLASGHHIRPGGELILGQEQDSLGGGFDSSQALVGELSQVGLWNRVLTPGQVASLARCGKVAQGSVAPWTENGVEVHGGATKDPGEPCSKHSRSSQ